MPATDTRHVIVLHQGDAGWVDQWPSCLTKDAAERFIAVARRDNPHIRIRCRPWTDEDERAYLLLMYNKQWAELDRRLGVGIGAVKERNRLCTLITQIET